MLFIRVNVKSSQQQSEDYEGIAVEDIRKPKKVAKLASCLHFSFGRKV